MPQPRTKRTRIKPELRDGEKQGLNRHWRGLFLDCLAETSNISEAAKRAGINPSRAYNIRREEEEFARQWRSALIEGYEHLEMELLALHRDTMAQEHAQRRNMDADRTRRIIDAKLEELRQEVIARREAEGQTIQ